MSLATGVTLMGRKQAEALMESSCVVTRAGAVATDPATGVDSPTLTTIYSGKCRLRFPDANSNDVAAAGQSIEKQSPTLSLPVDAASALVLTDDVATVTSPFDPLVIVVRIAGVHSQTHSTARRFPVEVLS